jgi:zinc protease
VNGQLADLWLYNLPLDYYTKLPAQIEGVTSADAQAAAEPSTFTRKTCW